MKRSSSFVSIAVATGMLFACLLGLQEVAAQTAPPKAGKSKAGPKTPPKKAEPKRPPMTKAEVQKLWNQHEEKLLLNELSLRGLGFEPDEEWVASLASPADQPLAIDELRKHIPPAPDVDTVAAQAPDLLAKLRDAAQKRNEAAMAPLLHPDLLANKASVLDLFDTTNYRGHSLGRITPMEHRRVGVQFFQLTTSQVERLHYVVFSNYGGKLVVRSVVTGQGVAELFLHDEAQLARSKLELVFRALNDGDATGLKLLCTPGLYESLSPLGSLLTPGKTVPIDRISKDPSVSLDQKSARVVVRVGYTTPNNRRIQYDVDFERIDKDLKVVRVRDVQGGVVAWDPDIDNYLNRRYGLPDNPPVKEVVPTDVIDFYPLETLHPMVLRAVEGGDASKLKDLAELMIAREPLKGEGYGIRAAFQQVRGNFDEAGRDAGTAIDRGGAAYFPIVEYRGGALSSGSFSNGVLAISKEKIEYLPTGAPREDFPVADVKAAFDGTGKTGILRKVVDTLHSSGGPFLKVEVTRQKKKSTFTFAALGTTCKAPQANGRKDLEQYGTGVYCGTQGTTVQNALALPLYVPRAWLDNLKVISDAVEHARQSGGKR